MATSRLRLAATAAFLIIAPAAAEAHPAPGSIADFAHGFAHPFLGLDHVIVMLTVGFYAAVLGGRAVWFIPSAFLAMIAAGGIVAINSITLPFVETLIAVSIIVPAAMAMLRPRLPVVTSAVIVGFFAIFHGHAHGAEIPPNASGIAYVLGFLLATALLHAAGIMLGAKMAKRGLAAT